MHANTRMAVIAIVLGLGMHGVRPAPARGDEPERKYLLERVDEAAVVQLYADGFSKLPLAQKVLIWHLYEAALAGRDIYYGQRHAEALAMRGVLEAILTHPGEID